MKVLSFDCANRSLAVCYLDINENFFKEMSLTLLKKESDTKEKIISLVDNYAIIHILKVFDLTKGNKCDTVERTNKLKRCLFELDELIASNETKENKIDTVLVEYQMSANDKSRCVSQQILYHYANLPCKLYLVGPTLKNKVFFKQDLDHGTFMSKYSSKYTANKNHTKENFLYWLKIYNKTDIVKDIKKKNMDDIADAFMQVFGWLEHYYFKKYKKT